MTEEQIQGNKLIAEFHGRGITSSYGVGLDQYGTKHYPANEIKYHSSWDWLIPACAKFDGIYNRNWTAKQSRDCDKLANKLDEVVAFYEIHPLFQQLVKCITWYNENK